MRCNRCNIEIKRRFKRGRLPKYCDSCRVKVIRENDRKEAKAYYAKHGRAKINERYKTNRQKAQEYMGKYCVDCGAKAVVYHHLDPKEKEANVSDILHSHSWTKIKMELDKCIPLCKKCHIKYHV